MPEYLAPGVYVEEVSFRSKVIEGVSTTTTGFVGPTRYGPLELEPDILTSLVEFEQSYGDRQKLAYGTGLVTDNYMWHAARAFFTEGGKRLYVKRIFRRRTENDDGCARASLPAGLSAAASPPEPNAIFIKARFPGAAGNLRVRFTLRLGQNVLGGEPVPGQPGQFKSRVSGLSDQDVVWVSNLPSPPLSPPGTEQGDFYLATSLVNPATGGRTWSFNVTPTSPPISPVNGPLVSPLPLTALAFSPDPKLSDKVRPLILTVTVINDDGSTLVWDGLALDPAHAQNGAPDSLFDKFAAKPANLQQARSLPIMITRGSALQDGLDVLESLFRQKPALRAALDNPAVTDQERSYEVALIGGNDGDRPTADEYEGKADLTATTKTGLKAFEDIEDISIIAAPGATFNMQDDPAYRPQAMTIVRLLIAHAELMRYRIAVLDAGNNQSIADVRAMRATLDSKYAALYYPWVRVLDPVTQREINLPPSGFVAGIYARNDINRAVYKAPANEVVNLALGFEFMINKAQQEILNPEGVNCFRFFEGRGMLLWGARTITSDGEWKYVNLRRYFAYLERSIDRGTQWAVFEPNGPLLWANVRRTIETFLLNEFQMGALLGDKPEQSYFVRCDRSTMTQNDLDNGRLVCLIGVAPLRPAEFVIFRIGQWTGDRKV